MIFLFYFAIILFILLCVILCAVIFMQESRTTSLGSAFGGDAGESLFGTATADIMKKITAWLAILFMVGCVLLSAWTATLGDTRTPTSPSTIQNR